MFNPNLRQQRVPVPWKAFCLIPVLEKTKSHFIFTPQIMKKNKELLLDLLRFPVNKTQNPLQFTHDIKMSVDDAILGLFHKTNA